MTTINSMSVKPFVPRDSSFQSSRAFTFFTMIPTMSVFDVRIDHCGGSTH